MVKYTVCHILFCVPQKSCWRGHRKRSQTVRNDLDCFKLSKWSDESPLMGRPLRLLFYLGLPLSIQAAFPMHKPHNTIHYSMSHRISCWILCTPTVANQVRSHIIVGALHSINPEMYYTVFSQSTSHDFSVPHHCINHDTGYFGVPHNIKDKLYYAQRAVSRSFFPAASDGCQCILTQIIHVSKNNFGIVMKRLWAW